MAQIEKLCSHCNKYYYYDDGLDRAKGVGNRSLEQAKQARQETNTAGAVVGRCPVCVDPRSINGITYKKITIIRAFEHYLKTVDIDTKYFDIDTILSMMRDMTGASRQCISLYESNGSYITVTLNVGHTFQGFSGNYELGDVKYAKLSPEDLNPVPILRRIKCLRCGKVSLYTRNQVLMLVTGLCLKKCKSCDCNLKDYPVEKRNTSGLRTNGRVKSEESERAKAKLLNVSRNDLRRWGLNERVNPLPVGTLIRDNLRITKAFWHDESMTPRYEITCELCGMTFTCIQKNVHKFFHSRVQCNSILMEKGLSQK